tara:strand:+ start:1600 stop:1962 length:363 start_codon:yes stop_codon:yes gene_type:complete
VNKLKAKNEVLGRIYKMAGFDVRTKVEGSAVSIRIVIKNESRDEQLTLRGKIPFGHDHKKTAYKEMIRGARTYVGDLAPVIESAKPSDLLGPFKSGVYWEGVATDALAAIKNDILHNPLF